jgi:putative transposase
MNGQAGRTPSRDGTLVPSSPSADKNRLRRPRLGGFDYVGRNIYHFVAVTHQRRPLLVGVWAKSIEEAMYRSATATGFEIPAYVVMPDHVHVLVQGKTDEANGVRFMQRFKQAVGYAFRKANGEKFWQESFYDHIVRRDEDVESIGRYISENPVRAGLVVAAEDWPYAGGTLLACR